jgi:uncharacterized membrane protein YadS
VPPFGGGSAIATLAPLVGARADQVGVAIGIVFLLNALGLFALPVNSARRVQLPGDPGSISLGRNASK